MPYFVFLLLDWLVRAAPFLVRIFSGVAVSVGLYALLNTLLLPRIDSLFQSITQQASSPSAIGDLAFQFYTFLGISHLVSLILTTGMVCIYFKIAATSVKSFSIKA